MKLLGFAALLLAMPVRAASPAVGANPATATVSAASLDLAKQMAPRDMIVEAKLREFDRHFAKSLLLNEDLKTLEAQFPGAVAAMAAASRPLLAEQMTKIVVRIQEDVAELLTVKFSADELAGLANFYRSPHIESVTQRLVGSLDQGQTYRSLADTGTVSSETINSQKKAAIQSTVQSLSEEERESWIDFAKTPVFAKLQSIRPAITDLIVKAMKSPDAVYENRVQAAIDLALQSHTALLKPEPKR